MRNHYCSLKSLIVVYVWLMCGFFHLHHLEEMNVETMKQILKNINLTNEQLSALLTPDNGSVSTGSTNSNPSTSLSNTNSNNANNSNNSNNANNNANTSANNTISGQKELKQEGFSVVNENFKEYDNLNTLPDTNSLNSKMLEYINQNQNDIANVSGEYVSTTTSGPQSPQNQNMTNTDVLLNMAPEKLQNLLYQLKNSSFPTNVNESSTTTSTSTSPIPSTSTTTTTPPSTYETTSSSVDTPTTTSQPIAENTDTVDSTTATTPTPATTAGPIVYFANQSSNPSNIVNLPDGDNKLNLAQKFELKRDKDGNYVLIPIKEQPANNNNTYKYESTNVIGNKKSEPQSQTEMQEKASNRQSLQISTLAQALYSPFNADKNALHLNLKGKDGREGKQGPKGAPGPVGPEGPIGPKGDKGDHGSCKRVVPGMYPCSNDEIEKISFQVDYLERVCLKVLPPLPFVPQGELGSETNPPPNCQAIYEADPNAKSGSYWLMVNGIKFKTKCVFDKKNNKGWSLVGRVDGQGFEFSAVSNAWADTSVINPDSATDDDAQTTMKSHAWFLLKNNAINVCFDGPVKDCATFTHNLGITLSNLFENQYGVVVEEKWTFERFLATIGKSCNLKRMNKYWCGLNMANICHPEDFNPNLNPTNHIVRIGCIGEDELTCTPDDYAVGIGVTSCYDGYGCKRVGPNTPSMHWACDPFFGTLEQIAYIYVS